MESTLMELGAFLGVGRERVRQIARKAGWTLQKYVDLYSSKTTTPKGGQQEMSCAIFSMGAATNRTLDIFNCILGYLITNYDVRQFDIQVETCSSDFINVLMQHESLQRIPKYAVIAESVDDSTFDNIVAPFCPLCDGIKSIDITFAKAGTATLVVATSMIDQADFCICNLSGKTFCQGRF